MRIAPPVESRPNIVPCGPRKHFDAVDVDELLRQEARGADLPNAIDVGADVRDAAHAEARAAGAAGAARDDDVRYALTDLFEVVDAARLEAFARDRDDGDGHLLEILLTAGGRDDDFLETFLGRSCLIRQTTDSRQCCHDRCVDFCDFHISPQKNDNDRQLQTVTSPSAARARDSSARTEGIAIRFMICNLLLLHLFEVITSLPRPQALRSRTGMFGLEKEERTKREIRRQSRAFARGRARHCASERRPSGLRCRFRFRRSRCRVGR